MVNDRVESAAITFQKHVRGFLVRKHFAIKNIDSAQHTSGKTMIVGNDPLLPDVSAYKTDEKIALIGTSGMRNIDIACELMFSNHIPKIIILDICENVCNFWRNFRSFIAGINNENEFFKQLPGFLDKNKNLYTHEFDEKHLQKPDIIIDAFGNQFLNQNPIKFFEQLIKKHGFDRVREITMHASILKQNWADQDVFAKIKNILTLNGVKKICMYASNIVATCNEKISNEVLQNIERLMPVFSIHTNACLFHSRAEKSYLFVDQSPDAIKQKISEVSHPNHTTLELVKLQLAELGLANTNNNDGESREDLFNLF